MEKCQQLFSKKVKIFLFLNVKPPQISLFFLEASCHNPNAQCCTREVQSTYLLNSNF